MFLEQVEAVVSLGAVQVRNACSSVVSVVRLAPFDGYITTNYRCCSCSCAPPRILKKDTFVSYTVIITQPYAKDFSPRKNLSGSQRTKDSEFLAQG